MKVLDRSWLTMCWWMESKKVITTIPRYLSWGRGREHTFLILKKAGTYWNGTFTVGTSMTTGSMNICTWANIHHKTTQNGGVANHGFPDKSYILNCNFELDCQGIPSALLLDWFIHFIPNPNPNSQTMIVTNITKIVWETAQVRLSPFRTQIVTNVPVSKMRWF